MRKISHNCTGNNRPKSATEKEKIYKNLTNSIYDEDDIKLNDFLDFMNVSCRLNEIIISKSKSSALSLSKKKSKSRAELNLEELIDNPIAKNLMHHKHKNHNHNNHNKSNSIGSPDLKKNCCIRDNNDTDVLKTQQNINKTTNGNTNTNFNFKGQENNNSLHPKLNEKLDYVINEGVLDAILPFICPIPVPSSSQYGKIRKKDIQQSQLQAHPTTIVSSKHNEKETSNCRENHLKQNDGIDDGCNEQFNESKDAKGKAQKQSSYVGYKHMFYAKAEKNKEPEVVIHVCDEVKNLSRDFNCPKSLLISKMGYFADVTAGQTLEDMDISVHCDIQIFEWLMKWIKQTENSESQHANTTVSNGCEPVLDASNVVPILVSASFLQMNPLLEDCLSFCHSRLSDVVRASTNLSCLNDSVLTRLAAMFTNSELEMVRDKKERVTPRLWIKLIESLCEPEPEVLRGHFYSLTGLFRCSKCAKCLTNTMKYHITCTPANTRLNRWGQLVSNHSRDETFDMSSYIYQLYKELKSWRRVYWKLWGHCHFLYCQICQTHFPVYQMAWCRFHPHTPNFLGQGTDGRTIGSVGRYECCSQQAYRFDTVTGPNGCQFREHSVLIDTDRERAIFTIVQQAYEDYVLCEVPPIQLQEFVSTSDVEPRWFGIPLVPQRTRLGLLPTLCSASQQLQSVTKLNAFPTGSFRVTDMHEDDESSSDNDTPTNSQSYHKYGIKNGIRNPSYFGSPCSSDGCESDVDSIKMKKPPPASNLKHIKKGKKRPYIAPGRFWSAELSARSNQDYQRDYEEKVMKAIANYIYKSSTGEHVLYQTKPTGGTYLRLEAEWKEQLKQRQYNSVGNVGVNKQKSIQSNNYLSNK